MGMLHVVATPIGNLGDLSDRARETLAAVDVVLAEDTRHSGALLRREGIATRTESLHDHNEAQRVEVLVARLVDGARMALVSDAGTPLISDPGHVLVRAARAAGVPVLPVPGPSAVIAALSVAGLAVSRFAFEGFLPARGAARRERLESLAGEPRALVFYEAPHRVRDTIADMRAILGSEREVSVARELTKLHEQTVTAPLGELVTAFDRGEINERGEFVLVVAPAEEEQAPESPETQAWLRALATALPPSAAARVAARATGRRRGDFYDRLRALSGKGDDAG